MVDKLCMARLVLTRVPNGTFHYDYSTSATYSKATPGCTAALPCRQTVAFITYVAGESLEFRSHLHTIPSPG